MAPESRTVNPDITFSALEEKLRKEPYRFDFFQAMRLLERLLPERTAVGNFQHPSTEVARFAAHNSLAFPASQIQSMEWDGEGPAHMMVNFMGLTGPSGLLPNPYTSLIIERLRASDTSAQDFFDIFNHRFISLFYRAWRKYRFDVAYERDERARFTRQLLSLLGLGTQGLQDRQTVPDDSLVYYAGLLAQRPRSAQALRQILGDYFAVPVQIEQFAGAWYPLDVDCQCLLSGGTEASEQLGVSTVVGDAMWNQQSRVRIVLGPLSLERYHDFLPDGKCWDLLRSWVRFFSDEQFDFDLELVLDRAQVPASKLGGTGIDAPQLGWVSWVKSRPFDRDPGDTVLALETPRGFKS